MKQSSFDLNLSTQSARKRVFLVQTDTVVPWVATVNLVVPFYSEGHNGRTPFALVIMLRVRFLMQQCFSLFDPALEKALFDTPLYREFTQTKNSHKWQVAMCLGLSREQGKENKRSDALLDQVEKIKTGIPTKVEHPFRMIKLQFGFTKVIYREL